MKPINAISWPTERIDSVKLLQHYMLAVASPLGLDFGKSTVSPLFIVNGLINGVCSESERRSALSHWWRVIDEIGIRDFSDRSVLIARLAVSLLSPTQEDDLDLGEQLSWFLEILGFLGLNVDQAIERMQIHFEFY